jgi:hypothetical protein
METGMTGRSVAFAILLVGACQFDSSGIDLPAGDPASLPEPPGLPGEPTPRASCLELRDSDPDAPSGVYWLQPDDGAPFAAYCDQETAGGGWTLVLKANGARSTFAYDSALWSSREPFAADSPDLDLNEAKLASFTRMPVDEVLVQLSTPGVGDPHHIVLVASADSLFDLVNGPATLAAGPGREAWLAALPGAELQLECTMEGFNLANDWNRLRIGLVANNEAYECATHDSRIGVGGGGCPDCTHCGTGPGMGGPSVGNNFKGCAATPAFAAVFVRGRS